MWQCLLRRSEINYFTYFSFSHGWLLFLAVCKWVQLLHLLSLPQTTFSSLCSLLYQWTECGFCFFLLVCAVDMCPPHHPWWIIHLQADERRAGEVWSAEVEWPWFLLAAGHLAIALVIIHASQMAFLWASVKRTGQGLPCQVLPGPKNDR